MPTLDLSFTYRNGRHVPMKIHIENWSDEARAAWTKAEAAFQELVDSGAVIDYSSATRLHHITAGQGV